jgi:hypothetical protein
MLHSADHINLSGDRFTVQCPDCGEYHGPYAPTMAWAEKYCSCGAVFPIDFEDRTAGKVRTRRPFEKSAEES